MASNDNLLWAASKGRDVLLYPFDSEALIFQAEVSISAWSAWKTEYVESIVDGYDNDILSIGEILSLGEGSICIATGKAYLNKHEGIIDRGASSLTSSMEEYEDRLVRP